MGDRGPGTGHDVDEAAVLAVFRSRAAVHRRPQDTLGGLLRGYLLHRAGPGADGTAGPPP